jgi:hypothetical protein
MKTFTEETQLALLPGWQSKLAQHSYTPLATGCHRWDGPLDKDGYGLVKVTLDGVQYSTGAHRAAWVVDHGTIPFGMTIDHLCRTVDCINTGPLHMEVVTNQENIRRRTLDNPEGTGRPCIPIPKRQGCGRHGRASGKFVTRRDGYVAWSCTICNKERMDRFRAKHH